MAQSMVKTAGIKDLDSEDGFKVNQSLNSIHTSVPQLIAEEVDEGTPINKIVITNENLLQGSASEHLKEVSIEKENVEW